MSRTFALPTALLLAGVLGAAGQLAAQGTGRVPAGAQPAVTIKPTTARPVTGKISFPGTGPITAPGVAAFAQSLSVSADGVHWGRAATFTYANPCPSGPPSHCNLTPAPLKLWLHWNPPVASDHITLISSLGYYLIDGTYNTPCWPFNQNPYVQGDVNMTHWAGPGPVPNVAQSYTCTYRIQGQTLDNGTPGHVTTNDVTIYVNVVQATP
jgi:hypothetical protein